jgi:hypothetical protein
MTFKEKILQAFPNAKFEVMDMADGLMPNICPRQLGEREMCPSSRALNVRGLEELCEACWNMEVDDDD